MWISDGNYAWNRDRTKIVDENDPEAAFVLITKGQEMPEDEARTLGLLKDTAPESKAKQAPAENKANPAPPETQTEDGPGETKEEPTPPKGELPDSLGTAVLKSLAELDPPVHTFHQLRKLIATGTGEKPWYTDVKGIGEATAGKLEEAVKAAPYEEG